MDVYALRSEPRAFEILFRRHAPRLRGFFLRTCPQEALAEDFLQQTFLHLHRARADFRIGSPFRPWLYAIATNVRREHFRRLARRPETALDPERHPEPSAPPGTTTASERLLRRCLAQLPDHQREVLVLHWYEDIGFAEIAEMLGESETAVKVRAHRAYEKLRAALGVEVRNQRPARPVDGGERS
jgi:RNA polymerase sigma-70 factor (ECF subfamily)